MKRTIVSLALLALIVVVPRPQAAEAASGCQFVLGFASLDGLIQSVVGDCLQNQHFALNGDALQQTAHGLMVWRKADNWTAFTDGFHTWINGPTGLQERLNTERFPWEPSPPPPRVAPAGGLAQPCFTTASGDCLHADSSFGPALTVLKTLPDGQWEENVAAQFGVPVALGDLSPGILGQYVARDKIVVLPTFAVDAAADNLPPDVLAKMTAAVLSHELLHATQDAAGHWTDPRYCMQNEQDAYVWEGRVWKALWNGQLPQPVSPVMTDLNGLVNDAVGAFNRQAAVYSAQCNSGAPAV